MVMFFSEFCVICWRGIHSVNIVAVCTSLHLHFWLPINFLPSPSLPQQPGSQTQYTVTLSRKLPLVAQILVFESGSFYSKNYTYLIFYRVCNWRISLPPCRRPVMSVLSYVRVRVWTWIDVVFRVCIVKRIVSCVCCDKLQISFSGSTCILHACMYCSNEFNLLR